MKRFNILFRHDWCSACWVSSSSSVQICDQTVATVMIIVKHFQVRLPDVEFFVNLGDWPLEKRKPPEKLHPIFSWCGSNNTRDIVMPTYDLSESVLETMGR